MNDLGPLTYFLGLEVHKIQGGLFINQHKYTLDLISQALLQHTTPLDTPLEFNVKCKKDDSTTLFDPTIYRKHVGSLVYLTINRPDISHAINIVNHFMVQPTQIHLSSVKRIIRYHTGRGIFSPHTSNLKLKAYSDADWAGCPD